MKKKRIRPIVLGVFLHEERILVYEGYDQVKQKYYYRPLGGGLKFGETGAEALIREIKEEINQEIIQPVFLGVIENIFTCDGLPGHEIVLVYSGEFVGTTVFEQLDFFGAEDDGSPIKVRWMELQYFRENPGLFVPEELLDLVDKKNR